MGSNAIRIGFGSAFVAALLYACAPAGKTVGSAEAGSELDSSNDSSNDSSVEGGVPVSCKREGEICPAGPACCPPWRGSPVDWARNCFVPTLVPIACGPPRVNPNRVCAYSDQDGCLQVRGADGGFATFRTPALYGAFNEDLRECPADVRATLFSLPACP